MRLIRLREKFIIWVLTTFYPYGGGLVEIRDNELVPIKQKECRHRWRVGAGIGGIINGKFETIGLNIWCEKCSKKIKAKYYPKHEIHFPRYKGRKKKTIV